MHIGMIGLGRMGANMVRRLMRGGHECVVHDRDPQAVAALVKEGAFGAESPAALIAALPAPRAIWIMVPAAIVDRVIADLRPLLESGDTIIDGGNSHYHHDIRRAQELSGARIHYVDVGTSGGVLGLERGFCLMIGGETDVVSRLEPIFATLSPGGAPPANRNASTGTASQGYLHCGPHGAGHFVKMIHNGIEYGLMAAYAEGFNILERADAGMESRIADAETAPLADPHLYQFQFNIGSIAELWRHGSIITSQLLDLTAAVLSKDASLEGFAGRVADSGEGRWTLEAAIDVGSPAYVLSAALFSRFASRGESEFGDKLLSAMRLGFGGHTERSKGS